MPNNVLISIINWNSSADTIQCLESVLHLSHSDDIKIELIVIDNASDVADVKKLDDWLSEKNIGLVKNSKNLGFAGGHNYSIKRAIDLKYDYVWLLNNDAIVYRNTLFELVKLMQINPRCGSCSPIIHRLKNHGTIDYCGSSHNWSTLSTSHPKSFPEAAEFCKSNADDIWLAGTAILFRVDALRSVGALDEGLFAYYEDNDIGVRLIKNGWNNLLAFNSEIEHACFDGVITDRKPYYFYLMARNSFLFYLKHTPRPFRKALRLRLLDNSLAVADGLQHKGYTDKANACLLGVADGLSGIGGPPALNRPVPFWLQCLRPIGRWWNRKRR